MNVSLQTVCDIRNNLKRGMKMELKLNISKVLILDTPLKGEMLENNQAVIGEVLGESVLLKKVDLNDITEQVKKAKKYFEAHDPYYALIKAEDLGEAVQLYIANVAGDSEESQDVEEELKEVSRDYALVKLSRSPGEDRKPVSIKETLEDFNSEDSSILIIDGSLL